MSGEELMSRSRPTPKLAWDSAYFLQCADDARAMAEGMRHPECKRIMSGVAETYEHLARQTKEFRRAVATLRSLAVSQIIRSQNIKPS